MKPILMICGFCVQGIAKPNPKAFWRESCTRCNGKGEVVILHAQSRYVGTGITDDEVWVYRNKGYKVTY